MSRVAVAASIVSMIVVEVDIGSRWAWIPSTCLGMDSCSRVSCCKDIRMDQACISIFQLTYSTRVF